MIQKIISISDFNPSADAVCGPKNNELYSYMAEESAKINGKYTHLTCSRWFVPCRFFDKDGKVGVCVLSIFCGVWSERRIAQHIKTMKSSS